MSTPQNVRRLDPKNVARLADLMDHRRRELGKSWATVTLEADITTTTLGALRKGQNYPSAKTLRGIDRAMEWEWNPSSTLAVLNGGDPVPLHGGSIHASEVAAVIAEIEALPNLSDEQKNVLISTLRATVQATLEQGRRLSEQQADRNAS